MKQLNLTKGYFGSESSYFDWMCRVIMFVAIAIGIYARLKGLGKWPLAEDEYYIAKSIRNIIHCGLPQFPCGGYYSRGILYQYIVAPFFLLGGRDELYLRIVPVFFNILAFIPVYKLTQKISGSAVASIAVAVFSISLWEIEFARFARMYSPFQSIFLFYIYFFYKVIIEKDAKSWKWLYGLSLVSIFVFEGAIFLAILNFVPYFLNKERVRVKSIAVSLTIFLMAFGYTTFKFRYLGADNYLPEEMLRLYQAEAKRTSAYPMILAQTIDLNTIWPFLLTIPLGVTVFLIQRILRSKSLAFCSKLFLCAALVMSFFNLFGSVFVLTLAFLLLFLNSWRELGTKEYQFFFLGVLFNLVFWIGYGVSSNTWYQSFFGMESFSAKKLMVVLFKYPDLYEKVINPWLDWVTILTLVCAFFISVGCFEALTSKGDKKYGYRLLAAMIIVLAFLVASVPLIYNTTRYTFFLYPLILILTLVSMMTWSEIITGGKTISKAVFLILIAFFITYAEDFSLSHMLHIDSQDTNLRTSMDPKLSYHFFIRYDFETPAEFVNDHISEDDVVVSVMTLPVAYYLDKLDFFYMEPHKFKELAACGGKKELWSNADLIYKEDNLFDFIDKSKSRIWLIARSRESYEFDKEIVIKIANKYGAYKRYKSLDGRFEVYEIIHDQSSGTIAQR